MSVVKKTVVRIATFDFKGRTQDVSLSTEMSWETVTGIIKLLFDLAPPFTLSFETRNGSHLELKCAGQLCVFLTSNYDKHIIDINRKVRLGSKPRSKKPSPEDSGKERSSSKNTDSFGDSNENLIYGRERNTFDIMEEEAAKKRNKKFPKNDTSTESSSVPVSDEEVVDPDSDPYNSLRGDISPEESFIPEDPLERAKNLQKICRDFKDVFRNHSSILLLSEILIDQILNGVEIDTGVLEKGLQRHSIQSYGFSLMENIYSTSSVPATSSSSAQNETLIDFELDESHFKESQLRSHGSHKTASRQSSKVGGGNSPKTKNLNPNPNAFKKFSRNSSDNN